MDDDWGYPYLWKPPFDHISTMLVNEAYIPFINHQSPSLIIYQSYGFIDDGMMGCLMGLEYNLVSNHEFKNHEWE